MYSIQPVLFGELYYRSTYSVILPFNIAHTIFEVPTSSGHFHTQVSKTSYSIIIPQVFKFIVEAHSRSPSFIATVSTPSALFICQEHVAPIIRLVGDIHRHSVETLMGT